MSDHEPTPYGKAPWGGGVRCSCGEDFAIGRHYPDTKKGNASRRRVRTMAQAWQMFRDHKCPPVLRETVDVARGSGATDTPRPSR